MKLLRTLVLLRVPPEELNKSPVRAHTPGLKNGAGEEGAGPLPHTHLPGSKRPHCPCCFEHRWFLRASHQQVWGHAGLGMHSWRLLCASLQIPRGKQWWVTEGTEALAGDRGQARQSLQHPGRGAIAALHRHSLLAGIATSQPCAGFDPYNTWDLSLSLSCAFKETPLFISFLLLFIITKSF